MIRIQSDYSRISSAAADIGAANPAQPLVRQMTVSHFAHLIAKAQYERISGTRSGAIKLYTDVDGTVIEPHGAFPADTLAHIARIASARESSFTVVTHTGDPKTLGALLAIPGVNVIGDSGAYLFDRDGKIAKWYVPQTYRDAMQTHRDAMQTHRGALEAIVNNQLANAPDGVRAQFKLLSLDVVYDKKTVAKEVVAALLKPIHEQVLAYIEAHGLSDLLKSDLRSYGDYWDLKVNYPIDKGVIRNQLAYDDTVIVFGDDQKYDLPMMRAAKEVAPADAHSVLVGTKEIGDSAKTFVDYQIDSPEVTREIFAALAAVLRQ